MLRPVLLGQELLEDGQDLAVEQLRLGGRVVDGAVALDRRAARLERRDVRRRLEVPELVALRVADRRQLLLGRSFALLAVSVPF